MTNFRTTNSPPVQPAEAPCSCPALAASIEKGSTINQRFGLNLPKDDLVLVAPDIPGLDDDAVYCPYDALGLLAEVQPLVIASSTVSAALIFDAQVSLTSRYFAQNLRSSLPCLLVSADGQSARLVRVGVAAGFADSVDDAARHFAAAQAVRPQAMAYLLSLHDLCCDFAGLLARNSAEHGQHQQVHIRCVLGGEHLALLGGMPFETFLALGYTAPSLGEIMRAVTTRP